MEKKEIWLLLEWVKNGFSIDYFYKLFGIEKYKNDTISKAIETLIELYQAYGEYSGSLPDVEKYFENEPILMLYSDIQGEFALSIKMAAEGYIPQSLREVRTALDFLTGAVFFLTSWVDGRPGPENFNPFYNAYLSGLWASLREFDINEMVLSELSVHANGEMVNLEVYPEKEGKTILDKIMGDLEIKDAFLTSKNKKNAERALIEAIRRALVLLFEGDKEEPMPGSQDFKTAKTNAFDPLFFLFKYMKNERLSLKSCETHRNDLINELGNKLEVSKSERDNLRESLSLLIFPLPIIDEDEQLWDFECFMRNCHETATLGATLARPNTVAMETIIEQQLSDEAKEKMSDIVSGILGHEKNQRNTSAPFTLLHNKIYKKLNRFAHGNIIAQPSLEQWYNDYFSTAVKVCTYLTKVMSSEDLKREIDWTKYVDDEGS